MNHTVKVPSRWVYLVALLIPIVGMMAAVIWLLVGVLTMGSDLYTFQVPATAEVEVRQSGRYTVDCEYNWPGAQAGALPSAPGLAINLTSKDNGDRLLPVETDVNIRRESKAYRGNTTHDFEINQPGTYSLAVSVRGSDAVPAGRAALIVGTPEVNATFGPSVLSYVKVLLRIGALVLASSVAGLALALTTHVRRHRILRRLTESEKVPAAT